MSTWPRKELKSLLRDLYGWQPHDELDAAAEAILQLVMPEDEYIPAPPGTWQNYIGKHGVGHGVMCPCPGCCKKYGNVHIIHGLD